MKSIRQRTRRLADKRLVFGLLGALVSTLFLLPVGQASAALYWGTGSGIARANLDGSALEREFVKASGASLCAIAVNSSHIYWADSYRNTIGRANLDGSNEDGDFITLSGEALPCGLALDSNFVYWPNMGTATIGRARLDGSEVDASFMPTVFHPCAVAVNETSIYWASDTENSIWRADIDGTGGAELVVDDAVDACGIALRDSHLLWVDSDAGTINRANLDGSEEVLGLVTGGSYPVSLMVHENQMYWANNGSGSIGRADLSGANVNQTLLSGLDHPYAIAVDSVLAVPRPVVAPPLPEKNRIRIGKLRRQRDGSVLFPIDLPSEGWLEAWVPGASVRVRPKGSEDQGRVLHSAGRKWIKIARPRKGSGASRCVLRAFRRGEKVKLALRLNFVEPGKTLVARRRPFLLFKPSAARSKGRLPDISCLGP